MRGYHIRISIQRQQNNAFIPKSVFQPLPNEKPRPTARKNALINTRRTDYRYGPIRLDWIDLDHSSMVSAGGKEKGQATAKFVPHTKSGSTNLPEGVVHVFRDASKFDELNELELVKERIPDEDCVILGVLAVPSWMTPSDFLTFVAPATEGMSHLRMIRDSAPNRSLVLLRFPKAPDAAEFTEAYNGKPFNSMEPETCHVVRVLSLNIDTDDAISFARSGNIQGSTYELPTCPVCLERMDSSVTGLITVPCSHTFHCMCLSKWGDSRCPVCRYSQTLLSSHPTSSRSSQPLPFTHPSTSALSTCADCASTTNLWICLICGNVGCGRYGRAHAHAHFQATTHLYALELETQRVWDYAGDGYVHRLIQNKADGKLVELPSASMAPRIGGAGNGAGVNGEGGGPGLQDRLTAEKIEAIGIEYSYLLTSQLDSQRAYYEEQMEALTAKVGEMQAVMDQFKKDAERERAEAREEAARRKRDEEARVAELERDRTRAEKRAENTTVLARRLEKELKEERVVSEGLMANLVDMRDRAERTGKQAEEFQAKISELEDQVRDVMFYLEAKNKIEQGDGPASEAAGGSIEIVTNRSSPKPMNRKKKARK